MSQTYNGGPMMITAVGFTAATAATSARTAIPVNSAGEIPRYIRIAGINECYVKLGSSTVVATANDILIQPADSTILAVSGATNVAYIQGTAAGKVNVVPLENI